MGTRRTCVPLPPAQVLQSCSPVSASHFGIDCIAVGSLASHSRRSDGCGLYAWRRANPGQKVWAGEPWILFWRRTWVAEVSGRDTRTRRLCCVQKARSGDRISDTQHPIGWGRERQKPARVEALRCPESWLVIFTNVEHRPSGVHRVVNDHHHVFCACPSRRRSLHQAGRWPCHRFSLPRARIPMAFYHPSSPAGRTPQAQGPPGTRTTYTLPKLQDC